MRVLGLRNGWQAHALTVKALACPTQFGEYQVLDGSSHQERSMEEIQVLS